MMLPTLLFALSSIALGQDDPLALDSTPLVYVAPFQARDKDAAGLAALLPTFLTSDLDGRAELRAIGVDGVGFVHDTPAGVYASSCPASEFVGCSFVVGEAAGAAYALAGTVGTRGGGAQVELHVIDVHQSEDVLSFQVDLDTGGDQAFADGVARVLIAVVNGQAGQRQDIREVVDESRPDYSDAVRDLEILSKEIGDVSAVTPRQALEAEQTHLTGADIAALQSSDAATPWDRLHMSPKQYLRYQNSGLNLMEWRARARGRDGRLLVRPLLGYGRGPVDGAYHGQFARSDQDFSIVETYTWQAVQDGSGLLVGGAVGYGLRPDLEVALSAGIGRGRYAAEIQAVTVGQTASPVEPETYSNTVLWLGPQLLWVPLPAGSVRPVVGGQAWLWRGTTVDSHVLPPEGLDTFKPPLFFSVGGLAGVEARMSDSLDLFLHLPVQAVIGGSTSAETHEGSGALEILETPPSFSGISATLLVGFQLRFLGGQDAGPGYDDGGDPDE